MIFYEEKTATFYLDTPNVSYVFKVLCDGILNQRYYGKKIAHNNMDYYNTFCERAFSPSNYNNGTVRTIDDTPQEYPCFGMGDFHNPAIQIENKNGERTSDLKYKSHTIFKGKPNISGMPQLLADNDDADTVEVTLFDDVDQLEVVLSYTVFNKTDVIARHVRIINQSCDDIKILKASSANVDLKGKKYEMISLTGAWGRERSLERMPIHHGSNTIESHRGASGHQLNPFMALVSPNTNEDYGDVFGFSLVYSGDFFINSEVDQFDNTRVQLGINPFNFTWMLRKGETFTTPEALMVYSSKGISGMSSAYHQACRKHLGKSKFRNGERPIIINNWEATYFDFNEESIKKLICNCKGLGIDTFVLDDGWFGKRDNDRCSLGDWEVNQRKLPNGLHSLIETCKENDMDFGLWVEPEMISEDSELYRNHPDWCIHSKGRDLVKSRSQLVLDLTRPEVCDYIHDCLFGILLNNDIKYIKWDMNRNITNNGSSALSPECQGELGHRYILGLYDIMEKITSEFPDVLFEGCSGGGGRFDFGILYYMPQIWTSDDSDAIARLKIQYGTSIVYPPSAMVGHVSACPNHQTGRTTPFETRADVAMGCNFGYELNIGTLTDEQRVQVKAQTAIYRQIAPLVTDGTMYRLCSPFEGNSCSWQLVSQDKKSAHVVYVRVLSIPNSPSVYLKLKGLDEDIVYHVEQYNLDLNGSVLMNAGLPLDLKQKDYYSTTIDIKAKNQ